MQTTNAYKYDNQEQLFTYSEWKQIEQRNKEFRKAEKMERMKVKLFGVVALGLSALEFILGYAGMIDEGGLFIIMIPLGAYLLLVKE